MQRFWLLIFLATAAISRAATHQSSTPQEVFDVMRANFHADHAKGLHARYQFELSGRDGGAWAIEVNDGKCHFSRAHLANPDVTIIASDRDWVALSNGTLNGTWAFFTGRLKIHGSHALARKLDEIF